MSDDRATTELPRSFLEEIKSLFGDVHEDFSHSILTTDHDLHRFLRKHSLALLSSGRAPDQMIDDFATTCVWMLLLGREHALRGYDSPLPRHDVEGADLITDDAITALIEDRG